MSLSRCAILVLVLVALGVVAVWEHLCLLSAGYKVNEARSRRTALEEEARALERRIDAMTTQAAAASRLKGDGRLRSGGPVRDTAGGRPERAGEMSNRGGNAQGLLPRTPMGNPAIGELGGTR